MFDHTMKYKSLCIALLCCYISSVHVAFAQSNDPVLFTYSGDTVRLSEFKYTYEKHAGDSARYSKKSVDDYLDPFINLKLKVRAAEDKGLQNAEDLKKELNTYRKQFAQGYLYDKDISEKLMKEAYERMKKEVRCRHILLRVDENASPADTLIILEQIKKIRKELIDKKHDFNAAAKLYSQDPSVVDNGGDLGYISVFQTVYPFETAAYNTPVGQVSQPFRTRFGYHLVQVDEVRKAEGKVQVAHILAKVPANATDEQRKAAEAKIKAISERLKKGEDFAVIAKSESDDPTSAPNGGQLDWFGAGTMLSEFETAAFTLKNKGDYSQPFTTKLGWHIVKLLDKKPIGTYEETKNEIKRRLDSDSRARLSRQLLVSRLKKEYQFKETTPLDRFASQIDTSILRGSWTNVGLQSPKEVLFSLTDINSKKHDYDHEAFGNFVQKNQRKALNKDKGIMIKALYNMFVDESVLGMEEEFLERKNTEFAHLMSEFYDATLLFALMEQEVWSRAATDSAGLAAFYSKHADKYKWDSRANASIYQTSSEEEAKQVKKLVEKKKSKAEIEAEVNLPKEGKKMVSILEGTFEKKQDPALFNHIKWEKGISALVTDPTNGTVRFAQITEILPPQSKKLEEARGYVIADYQAELEKSWVQSLRDTYKPSVNRDALKTLYK